MSSMLSVSVIQSGVGLALVAYLLWITYRALASPLRDIPGPTAAHFTRWWYFNSIWKGQAHLDNILQHRLGAKPGEYFAPIVRLGPNLYSITSAEKNVYGVSSKMPKNDWYEGWKHPSPERFTLFTDQDIERHAKERRKFQSMYSLSSLLRYEQLADDVQSIFKKKLDEMAESELPVNMHHWLRCYAFDVIGCITYSRRFGFLDEGKDIQSVIASLDALGVYGTLVGVFAWLHPYLYPILEKIPSSGAAGRSYLMTFIRKRIAEREIERESQEVDDKKSLSDSTTRDFLDLALDAEQDPTKGTTKYNVFMLGISNIIAGSDTTAGALTGILWHLTAYPDTLAKLRKELDQAIAEGKMTADRITFKESQTLPYLQAVIKEGQRMTSSVGLPLWRVVPKGGAEIQGRYFPEGSEIGLNPWVAHYNKDVWGPDALQFNPDRWIEAAKDPERLRTLEANYLPFGLGSRTCIGRHISYLEMFKVVPMIVSQFDFELLHPAKELRLVNFWLIQAAPDAFKVVVRKRKQ